MSDLLVRQSMLQLAVTMCASLGVTAAAVAYLRRYRLERPAIGTFNLRDIAILMTFIVVLPVFYLSLPYWILTPFLVLTFGGALSMGLRPLLPRAVSWTVIGVLLGANLWVARTMLGTQAGWQLYWVCVGLVVFGAAVCVSNLYVQGGMQLRHAAYFTLALAVYDFTFSTVLPLTPKLADRFQGHPLNAAIGMRWDVFNAAIGVGDLLAFAVYAAAAYKAYGAKAMRLVFPLVVVFGAVAPSLTPLVLHTFTRGSLNIVVPVQSWFGPPAFLLYLWMRKHFGPERTTARFRADLDADQAARPQPQALPVPVNN
jgi:hypothetical protein